MSMRHWFRQSIVLLGIAALASCASGGGGAEPAASQAAGESVTVNVTNDLVPPSTVVIWMDPTTGGRRRLGEVQPNAQGRFTFNPAIRNEDHQLVAERTGGGAQESNPFVLTGVSTLQWNVSSRVVRTSGDQMP